MPDQIYSSCRRLAGPAVGVRALRFLPRSASLIMAVEGAHDLVPDGPAQRGRGIHGQYVYWTTMSHPRPETVQQLSLRTLALLPAPPSCLTAPETAPDCARGWRQSRRPPDDAALAAASRLPFCTAEASAVSFYSKHPPRRQKSV